ncbi:hypothetical protein Tco_1086899 [Tanacetum coccineum]
MAPSDEEVPVEVQLYAVTDSPIALSPGYIADSDPEKDPEEDSEDGPVHYPADGGNGDDDDSSNDDDKEEEASEEEEDEHLALAGSVITPVVDHVPSSEEKKPISNRPEAPILLVSEEEVERLLALPILPPSPLISLSPPSIEERLARCFAAPTPPSSPLPPPPSSLHLQPPVPTSPLPPLPASLSIPPLVDCREDIPEAELPPRKRLCSTASTSRYEVGESSTAAPRPTGGHRVDYGFIDTLDAEARRQRPETVGYRIRDTWVDPREAAEEIAPVTLEGTRIFQSVEALIDDRQYHYETARLLDHEALVSREAWAHSMGLSSAVHYEL